MVAITTPCAGVCAPWSTVDDVCAPCSNYDVDQAILERMLDVASDLLFELSGRQFPGICQDIVRPCGRSISNDGPAWHGTWQMSGNWAWNRSWGFCRCNRPLQRGCGCQQLSEITLGRYPVLDPIIEVKVDGVTLDPSEYRVHDNRYLARLPDADGNRKGWPCCQDLALPATEPNTFEVAFYYGQEPPPSGKLAAEVLACELTLACQQSDECRLPKRLQSITRQGVTAVVLDAFDFLNRRRTGLIEVDAFLAAHNPHGLTRRATVVNPDLMRPVRRYAR